MPWHKPAQKIPSENPVIPRETVEMAHKVLQARMMGEPHPTTKGLVTRDQAIAATDLLKLHQTQDRYTPERVKQLAATPKASEGIRELAALDDEALEATTRKMLKEAGFTPSA